MSYQGDVALGKTVHFKFTTRQISGAPHALASGALAVYEEDNTTQITAGVTLDPDFDGVTGLNRVAIVASGANGYESGKNYDVVLTAGTVNSVSVVGEVVGNFSVEARSALRPTTADRTLDVSATGEAGLDFDNYKAATAAATPWPKGLTIANDNGTALTLSSSGGNGLGLSVVGHGTGYGAQILSGTGAAAVGMRIASQAGSGDGHGLRIGGAFSGQGIQVNAGATGVGAAIVGGSTSGRGLLVSSVDGHAMVLSPGSTGAVRHGLQIFSAGGGVPIQLAGPQIGSTGNDTTHLHLPTLGGYEADELVNYFLTIEDNSSERNYLRRIKAWDTVNDIAEVDTLPFNPASASDRAALTPFGRADVVAINTPSLAEIATEIADAIRTDTIAAPTGVPGDTVPLSELAARIYQILINRIDVDQGTGEKTYYNAAGTPIWKKPVSDDGTTYSETKGVAP